MSRCHLRARAPTGFARAFEAGGGFGFERSTGLHVLGARSSGTASRTSYCGSVWLCEVVVAQTEDAAGAYDTVSTVYWDGPDGPTTPLPTLGAADVAAADLDRDGWPELVFANLSDGVTRSVESWVYRGGPDGLSADRRVGLPTVGASDVEIADVDGDGWLDLAFANRWDGSSAASADAYRVDVTVYLGGPDGFAPERVLRVPGFGTAQVAAADLDGDGWVDLALAAGTFWTDESWVYLGGPDGFTADRRLALPTLAPEGVIARDLDADGWLDLVYANFYDDLVLDIDSVVYWGGPDGFTPDRATPFPTHGADDLVTVDVDGDGCEELVVANAMEGDFGALDFEVGSAVWAFGPGVREPVEVARLPTVSAAAVAAGDVDGDGAPDLAFANRYDPEGEAGAAVSTVFLGPDLAARLDLPAAGAAGITIVAP